METYIKRAIEADILRLSHKMPVIIITGPRQSGKTTLVKHLFKDFLYVNLEYPDIRDTAQKDPRQFLNQSETMIIDEVQRVPDLISYIQGFVDENSNKKYILTGSNNFALMNNVSQSLAGRASIFTLLPFSFYELENTEFAMQNLNEIIFNGWYPRVRINHNNPLDWYKEYIQTYLERDVRAMGAVHMIEQFYNFLRICALRVGGTINYAGISREVGASANTIRGWISILEASYIVYTLPPYHKNHKNRITKSSKLYFYDTGLLCSLLSITKKEDISQSHLFGQIFENFIIAEYIKNEAIANRQHSLYFYRDEYGNEVDIVKEIGEKLDIIEIKSNKTFSSIFVKGLNYFENQVLKSNSKNLIYGGDNTMVVDNVNIISWKKLKF